MTTLTNWQSSLSDLAAYVSSSNTLTSTASIGHNAISIQSILQGSSRLNELTYEERQQAYDALAKLAALGHDEAVELLKRLLGVVDEAQRVIDQLQRDLEYERSRARQQQTYPQPWTPSVTPSYPGAPTVPPNFPPTWGGGSTTTGTAVDTSWLQESIRRSTSGG